MKWGGLVWNQALRGIAAGLVGGLVAAVALYEQERLPAVAALAGATGALAGLGLLLLIAALGGAGFAILTHGQRSTGGELLFWGLTYGALGWFLGQLTLVPLLGGDGLQWDIQSAQAAFPSLPAYMFAGAGMGLALAVLRRERGSTGGAERPALLRGALAGLLSSAMLAAMLQEQDQLLAFSAMMTGESRGVAWLVTLAVGVVAGIGFAALFPATNDGAGPSLIRGTVYGFCWWVAGALTIMPLVGGTGLAWSVEAARAGFALLPGYLLFGAALALLRQWIDALARLLFSDVDYDREQESVGARGLRALGYGALAGLAGGLLFTLVMVQIGFLPVVASLVGARSALTGFVVHLIIANLIGASYGLLFRQRGYDSGSALGWGVSYGFFWWVLGPLTLLPILLGVTPQWTVEIAAQLMASLIGHLLYGAGLGVTLYLLEARYNPWWIALTEAEALRSERRKGQLLTSAPALWALVVIIALTIPVLLGM